MPIIQVYYAQGLLDATRKAAMAQRLTDVLLTMEGGARTPGGLAFASVLFTEMPAEDWWVGGRTDDTYVSAPGRFLARVSIPEGYMNQFYKTQVHAAVNTAIVQTMDEPASSDAGAGALVIIEEVAEGNWGARGKTISLASIAQSVGQAKDGARFKWIQSYFAAKARQYAAAGYPKDMGGLLSDQAVQSPSNGTASPHA
jgi:phenylpyruvate tautomerase PptA (4-oxalocrotonate tautomerase family)